MSKKPMPMDAAFIDTDEEVFIADDQLRGYLKRLGYRFVISDSRFKYYVKDKIFQVRVDPIETGEIALLNRRGDVIYKDTSIRVGQLDTFTKTGAL